MKNLTVLSIVSLSLFLFSCQKDDSDDGNSNSNASTYDGQILSGFKMWVAGDEINTEGLDIYDLIPEYIHEGIATMENMPAEIMLDGDSLRITTWEGENSAAKYTTSNDSIFVDTNSEFGVLYFALQTDEGIIITRGFMYSAHYPPDQGTQIHGAKSEAHHYTFENTLSEHGFESLDDMNDTDTLVIKNQSFLYN